MSLVDRTFAVIVCAEYVVSQAMFSTQNMIEELQAIIDREP